MKISTKGTYGLISMVDIALNSNSENLVSVADIAKRQHISKIYLEQVISNLRKSNLLIGVKGPQGGYSLAKPPSEMTVLEILEALEGNLFEISMDKQMEENSSIAPVLEKQIWKPMGDAINHTAGKVTLQDLVDDYHNQKGNFMYYI
ncbi:MAG TPA: Rrf2 family transcriptional regulator [Candidatus Merdenecus merdavium]|nr:Rrf2 family transcriptional regulator [Candidatus Merdenecus merdavium]